MGFSFRGWAVVGAACASLLVSTACGSDREFSGARAGAGGDDDGASSGAGGSSPSAGNSAGGGSVGGGGAGSGDGGAINTLPKQCTDLGVLRCQDNVREQCTPAGEWQRLPDSEQCGGATPACSGNGVCAAFRQRAGGIDTFAIYPSASNAASYVLRRQTLTKSSKTCGTDYCVGGGITP